MNTQDCLYRIILADPVTETFPSLETAVIDMMESFRIDKSNPHVRVTVEMGVVYQAALAMMQRVEFRRMLNLYLHPEAALVFKENHGQRRLICELRGYSNRG